MLETNAPAMTSILPGLTRDFSLGRAPPSSVVYAPAWTHRGANTSYATVRVLQPNGTDVSGRSDAARSAMCAMGFNWDAALHDTLPRAMPSAVVVLRAPDGTQHTFAWRDGAVADGGGGDRHAVLLAHSRHVLRHSRAFNLTAAGQLWSVRLLPTGELYDQFVTSRPRNSAIGIVAASIACVVLFGVYEFFVRRRAELLNAQLRAHVAQLQRMQKDLEDGCAREAQAQARLLADEAGCAPPCVVASGCMRRGAWRIALSAPNHVLCVQHRRMKQKEQFVAMVSHEARSREQHNPAFCLLRTRQLQVACRCLCACAALRCLTLAHARSRSQIRTPLNAMSGAVALLAGTSPLSAEQRSLLQLLDAATEHTVLIIEDILQHGALSSGNFPLSREPLSLSRDVLEPAWRMVELQPARRDKLSRLRLARAVAADVPDAIVGDATRLLQVVTNLLSNAVKFTPEGESIELLVDVTCDAPAGAAAPDALDAPRHARWLRIRVVDTGIGIAADKLERVFEPFVQAEMSTVRQYGGTGLGLTARRRSTWRTDVHTHGLLCLRRRSFVFSFADLPAHRARDGRRAERQQRRPRQRRHVHVHHPAAAAGACSG